MELKAYTFDCPFSVIFGSKKKVAASAQADIVLIRKRGMARVMGMVWIIRGADI
jgi:hypothetical protein